MHSWIKVLSGGPVSYDYEIMRDPVTNAEYCAWLNGIPQSEAVAHYTKLMAEHFFGGIEETDGRESVLYRPKSGFENKPVVFASWHDAKAYGKWAGGRLPTEIEWRKAAAWMPDEHRFATWCTGCDVEPTQRDVNFYDFEDGWALPSPHLADVNWHKPSGAYGCRGMAGNVAEWCVGESTGWQPALGGSLFRPKEFMLCSAGEADHPTKRLSTFGFRLVREANK